MKLLCLGVGLQGEEGQLTYLPSLPHVLSLIEVLSVVAVSHPYVCNLGELLGFSELLRLWPGQISVLELLQLLLR